MFVNDGGIQLDAEKFSNMPPGWNISDQGYTEQWRGDGDNQVVAYFEGPWSTAKFFVDWVLGYSVNTGANPVPSGAEGGYTPDPTPLPEGGGYSAYAGSIGATQGKLLRQIPAQVPFAPWLYAVACELEHGLGRAVSRNDMTVLANPFAGGYVPWDTGGYSAAPPELDPLADGGVQAAQNALNALQQQQQLAQIFPLGGGGAASQQNVWNALNGGVPYVPANAAAYTALLNAPSFAALNALAAGGNVYAGQYVAYLAGLQAQVLAAQQALAAAIAAFEAANTSRRVVPWIAFDTQPPTPTMTPTPPGYTWPVNKGAVDGMARFRVTYRGLPYEVRSDRQMALAPWLQSAADDENGDPGATGPGGELNRWVVRETEQSIKGIPIPPGGLKFYEGPAAGQSPSQAGTLYVPMRTLIYTWHDVPDVNWDLFDQTEAHTNSDIFDGCFGAPSYAADTLLMEAPKVSRNPRGVRGRVMWTVKFHFVYNPNGWNFFPVWNNGVYGFYGVSTDGNPPAADGSNLVYKRARFGDLFNVLPLPVDYQVPGRG
jgi:hypothetical protein